MNYYRVDPILLAALDDYGGREDRAGPAHPAPFLGTAAARGSPRPTRAVVFIDLDDGATLGRLPTGVEVSPGGGPIRTGTALLESIDPLSEMEGVRRIVAARLLRPHMDIARERVGIASWRRRSGASGRGVVIGVIDTGLETNHPAFAAAGAGADRLLRLWDQTLPGSGVAEGGYGVELQGDLMGTSVDSVGHGTHVAGVAAGDDATYGGVAPAAALVIVKSDLLDAHVADGLRYVFRVATELGRPAVAVVASGTADDAHDGTDPLSMVVDAQSGPGRIVCCSAGNQGDDATHAQLEVALGQIVTVACPVRVPSAVEAQTTARITGWYAGGDELAVAVVSPTGVQSPFQPVATDGPPAHWYQLPDGDVRVITPGPDPANGDHRFLVEVTPSVAAAAMPTPAAWALRLRGDRITSGRLDLWSIDAGMAQLAGEPVRNSVKVDSPGAASRAVTVGSFTTKVEWANLVGHDHQAGFSLDDVSSFTSPGPRRDGAPKPDLVAPGAMVAAALSARSPFHVQCLVDNFNVLQAGTSVAAAFVAGLVALLLETRPSLTPEEVKALLRARCRVPGQAPGSFDPVWGYGLIDAGGLADDLAPATGS
ncbi:MAG: S8 family serine peptidase [Acidimicrobiales bacterium]